MTHSAPESDRERFKSYYATPKPPWDIGRPQRPFMEAGDTIHGRVLDSGCGTGELALWLAERGCRVTGVDFLDGPLVVARSKAAERGLEATFLEMDALAIGEIPERFDAVTDCGLFHVFDDAARAAICPVKLHVPVAPLTKVDWSKVKAKFAAMPRLI